jgi:hypothetical protein
LALDMKVIPVDPPRVFEVGHRGREIALRDTARIALEPDEQVTFVTESGAEYDVVRKSWGFYATPSLNGRLVQFGLRAALVRSANARVYVLLAERDKEAEFLRYLDAQEMSHICWLDSERDLAVLQRAFEQR